MKKVIIISDSHGNLDNVRKIVEKEKNYDMVIHLGDLIGQDDLLKEICKCEIKCVRGNCDLMSENPLFDVVEVEKNKIFITHGHCFGVNFGVEKLCYAAEEEGCKIAMYGHTHVPIINQGRDVTILNPGSLTLPRQDGFVRTYILMEIDREGEAHFTLCKL